MDKTATEREKSSDAHSAPSARMSASTSLPDIDNELNFAKYKRKQSAPTTGLLSTISTATDLGPSVGPCATPVKPRTLSKKFRKHAKMLLPNKPAFFKKIEPLGEETRPSTPIRPSELNIFSSLPNMKKRGRDRKFSYDLESSPIRTTPTGRKFSCDLSPETPLSPASKANNRKSFLFSFSKMFHRGSKSPSSDDSPGVSPVSIVVSHTGDERRRAVVDFESLDSGSEKSKLSSYNKLIGKSMELVSLTL